MCFSLMCIHDEKPISKYVPQELAVYSYVQLSDILRFRLERVVYLRVCTYQIFLFRMILHTVRLQRSCTSLELRRLIMYVSQLDRPSLVWCVIVGSCQDLSFSLALVCNTTIVAYVIFGLPYWESSLIGLVYQFSLPAYKPALVQTCLDSKKLLCMRIW